MTRKTRMTPQLRRQIRRDVALWNELVDRELLECDLLKGRVRRAEVALYTQLLSRNAEFTERVGDLAHRCAQDWHATPESLPFTPWNLDTAFARALARICRDFRITGLVRVGDAFVGWIARPYPPTPVLGGALGGRWGTRGPLVRRHGLQTHLELYDMRALGRLTCLQVASRRGGPQHLHMVEKATARLAAEIVGLKGMVLPEASIRGELTRRRRACVPEDWRRLRP